MYPKYAPITELSVVKTKPITLVIIPAIARFRLDEPRLTIPRIKLIEEIGNPHRGNNHARRLNMPSINDVMANS